MTPRERRIAEAVRDACVAEFSTRADDARDLIRRGIVGEGAMETVTSVMRSMDANAALLRAVDVAAVVATVPAEADPGARVREHTRRVMDALLETPGMFGDDAAVEVLMLSSLETLCVMERPDAPGRFVIDAYIAFAHRRFPESGNRRLCDHLQAIGRASELFALLAEFRAEIEPRICA